MIIELFFFHGIKCVYLLFIFSGLAKPVNYLLGTRPKPLVIFHFHLFRIPYVEVQTFQFMFFEMYTF